MTAQAFVIRLVDGAGLGRPARRVRDGALALMNLARKAVGRPLAAARAAGLLQWSPLVPERQFHEFCIQAIGVLRARGVEGGDVGDYLEFGVSRGTSLALMHRALDEAHLSHVRLLGFDSFEGLPPDAEQHGWEPGKFRSTLGATRRYLTHAGVDWGRVTLVRGWFEDTLTPEAKASLGLRKASLIMVDCDLYPAARDSLRFCAPLIWDHAVIVFDDWGWDLQAGEKKAFEEFLAEFPEFTAEPLPVYTPAARAFLVSRSPAPPLVRTRRHDEFEANMLEPTRQP